MRKIVLTGLAGVFLIGIFSFKVLDENFFEIKRNLDIFGTLFSELDANYVDELDAEELVIEGIDAMLASLDPYADFIPESELESYKTSTTGEYGGIGAVVGKKNGVSTVVMPYKGFPAYEAGLRIGDQIMEIDGQSLDGKKNREVSEMLKGKPNTVLLLKVKRYGFENPIEINVERAQIVISNVGYHGMYNEEVGIIQLTDFTTNASKEVTEALNELKSQGAKKIILDLRGNPGGLLSEAIHVANVFLPKGKEIVSTRGKTTSVSRLYKSLSNPVDTDIPLAVLINRGTASASEIVSGSIQDYDRGVLLGKKTFGKGLVQGTRQLPYDTQLKLTTAKYYIPSGRCIQAIDYANRNEDGSVGKIADSLKLAFKTENGRTVYDGGGIDPDIEVEMEYYSNLLMSIVNQNVLFDYATKYHFEHKEIASAREFQLSDAEYNDFLKWAQDRKMDFSSEMDRAIKSLEETARNEKYYDGLKPRIDELKSKLSGVRESYLTEHEEEVKSLLEEDIVSRYYMHTGIIEASLNDDPVISQAVEVLNDTSRYNKLLAKK